MLAFIVGVTYSVVSSHTIHNEPLGALSSSTTYYQNGSNFYTLSSSQQHYKCTNSSHSGSNDYTTSSVSGTCYTTSSNTSYTTQYYSHSCSAVYGSHSVSASHTYGSHHAGGKQYLDQTWKAKCSYCGATKNVSVISSGPYDWGTCTSNIKSTTYTCSYCSKSSSSSFSGTCTSHVTGYKCSYCNQTFSSNSTANCSSRSWKKCSKCGGDWSSCSCKVTSYHNHSISASYVLYSYKNIDTNGTSTSQSAYTRATGYTVSFNANGGSGSMSSQYFLHGHSQAINSNAFSRSGYGFQGWSTSSTATTPTYSNGQAVTSITTGSSATLYAVWRALNYTVYYDLSGFSNKIGTLAGGFENTGWSGTYDTAHVRSGNYSLKITATTSSPEVTITTSSAIAIDSSTKSHIYYFQYWGYQESTLSNATTQIYWPIEEPSFGSIKLGPAGQWNQYSFYGTRSNNALAGSQNVRIDFDNRNEAGTIWFDDLIMLDLTEIYGAGNEPTKDWCDKNVVTGVYSQVIQYDTATALTKKPTTLNAEGYTFKGWSTAARANTTQTVNYADGASVTNIASAGGNITLYGVWDINSYTVSTSFTPSTGGSVSGGGTYNYYTTVNVTATPANDYFLEYWEIDGQRGGTSNVLSILVTHNTTIQAHFKLAKTYSYATTGGEVRLKGNDFQGGTSSTTATYEAIPYAGYYLIGWSVNGAVYAPSGTIYKERTLTLSKADSQGYGVYAIFSTDANATPSPSYDLNLNTAISARMGGEARVVGCDFASLADTDTITYIAVADKDYKFDGWYIDGVQVSANLSDRFAKSQVYGKIVEARFSLNNASTNDDTNNTDDVL